MSGPKVADCKSCHAPIFFVETPKGKLMPLDAEPSETGTWRVWPSKRPDGASYGCAAREGFDGARYTPHFASCPSAAEHRRPRGSASAR